MGEAGLISMPEIAELAGVQRPVVTNWRRRHPDTFPKPAGGDATRPLFDAREIVGWLDTTGRGRPDLHADLHQYTLAHLGDALGAADLVAHGTALICLRLLDDEPLVGPEPLVERARRVDPGNRMLLTEIESLPAGADGLPEAMDNLVEAAWGCKPAFERLLAGRDRLGVPVLSRDAIVPQLGRLVAALSGADVVAGWRGMVRVVDLWAGGGDVLAAVLEQVGEEGAPLVTASTPSEYLTRLLRRRLAVCGIPGEDQEIVTQDATRLRTGEWDVLVTRLPYQSIEQRRPEPGLSLLRDVAKNLHSGQCAIVLTPADLLGDRLAAAAATMRAEILRTGRVEAIVSLPGGLMPYRPGYRMALWVLREDESGRATGRVMLADVSDRGLTTRLVDGLVEDITTWRREGFHPAAQRPTVAHTVTLDEVLTNISGLSQPRRPEVTEAVRLGPSRVGALIDIEARLARHAQRERPPALRSGVVARDPGHRRTVTVGALLIAGRLTRIGGTRLQPRHVSSSGHHRVIGVPEIVGPRPGEELASRFMDRAVLAGYPRAQLTEPGDVVVVLAPRPAAFVDDAGFSVVEFPATALRLHVGQLKLTARVLAALVDDAPLASRAEGTIRGIRLDQLHLPQLDDDEAMALDALLEQVEERHRRAREELDTLDALRRTTLAGLADGTLTVSVATA